MPVKRSVIKFFSGRTKYQRIIFILLLSMPLYSLDEVNRHFREYLTAGVITRVVKGEWHIALMSILFFISFLIPLSYRRKANWSEYGLVIAFFVSLFIEMYGIPFTLLFVSKYMNPEPAATSLVLTFQFMGINFGFDICMAYGFLIMGIGMVLIVVGWITLYKNVKKNRIVTSGIYGLSRHPQYVGFILVIYGWTFGWPTIMTLILSFILIFKYIRVSRSEELEVSREFPEYDTYRKNVPFLI
jgi:methanethiol S-methyltransferase